MRSSALGVVIAACTVPAPGQVPANPRFLGVGDLPGGAFVSRASSVSYWNMRVTVVGESEGADGVRAFRWTDADGIQNLGVLVPGHTFSSARAVSYIQGTLVVGMSGTSPSPADCVAFFWWPTQGMRAVTPIAGLTPLVANAIVDDIGIQCVGQAATASGERVGFYSGFTSGSGVALPSAAGLPQESAALDVNWNGSWRVGYARDASSRIQASYWTNSAGGTAQGLGFLNSTGFQESRANAVSDINTIVGQSTSPRGAVEAFRWGGTGPMTGLGDLPGGEFRSAALAVTWFWAPEHTIVGWSEAGEGERAFIWKEATGMRDLKSFLESAGFNVAGWTLLRATAISSRGRAIVGDGINPLGQPEAWLADFGCYPDCNADLQRTVADFGCFQTRFVAGDDYADCNLDGALTVADFGCFQSRYQSPQCDQ